MKREPLAPQDLVPLAPDPPDVTYEDATVIFTWVHGGAEFSVACAKLDTDGSVFHRTKTNRFDLELVPGTYVFRVRAESMSGSSSWSDPSAEFSVIDNAENIFDNLRGSIYSPITNCCRPMRSQNAEPIGGATLKNSATLISSAPSRRVVAA